MPKRKTIVPPPDGATVTVNALKPWKGTFLGVRGDGWFLVRMNGKNATMAVPPYSVEQTSDAR